MFRNSLLRLCSRTVSTSSGKYAPIKVGESAPFVVVQEMTPNNDLDNVNMADLFKQKRVVLFGVPGAFTTTCHKSHLPGFVKNYAKFTDKGIDVVACLAVNDAFVMDAWGKATDAVGKIRMFADTNALFTKAADLDFDIEVLGGVRCKRFSMFIEDGVVKVVNIESAPGEVTNTAAEKLLDQI